MSVAPAALHADVSAIADADADERLLRCDKGRQELLAGNAASLGRVKIAKRAEHGRQGVLHGVHRFGVDRRPIQRARHGSHCHSGFLGGDLFAAVEHDVGFLNAALLLQVMGKLRQRVLAVAANHAADRVEDEFFRQLNDFRGNIVVFQLGRHPAKSIDTVFVIDTGELFHFQCISFYSEFGYFSGNHREDHSAR